MRTCAAQNPNADYVCTYNKRKLGMPKLWSSIGANLRCEMGSHEAQDVTQQPQRGSMLLFIHTTISLHSLTLSMTKIRQAGQLVNNRTSEVLTVIHSSLTKKHLRPYSILMSIHLFIFDDSMYTEHATINLAQVYTVH